MNAILPSQEMVATYPCAAPLRPTSSMCATNSYPPKQMPTYAKEKLQEQLTAFFGKTDTP
jgi:hypothetical protein